MTESEELFRRFCKSQGWHLERIDEQSVAQGSRVPDFRLRLEDGAAIVVEVKQFDPNPEEKAAELAEGSGVLGGKPGQRLREVISKANNQLKALRGTDPGMLVVYNRTICELHDDCYAVLTAMRGLDVIEYRVPADQGSPIVPVRERSGPGKKLTREMNTSISCIAVLREFFNGDMIPYGMSGPNPEYAMAVYHSPFAKHPLDPELLASSRVRHYRMSADEKSWEPYPS